MVDSAIYDRYDPLHQDMICSETAIAALSATIDGLCRDLELPRTLREVDVPEAGLAHIATAALHDRSLSTTPKPINDAGPIMEGLRAAY